MAEESPSLAAMTALQTATVEKISTAGYWERPILPVTAVVKLMAAVKQTAIMKASAMAGSTPMAGVNPTVPGSVQVLCSGIKHPLQKQATDLGEQQPPNILCRTLEGTR